MDQWDVIVVGAGTAGIPTALFAADRGARVLLIDAAAEIGGTLHLSSGSVAAAGGARQAAQGIEDSPERHLADSLRINHGTGDIAKLRLWQDQAEDTLQWLIAEGLEIGDDQPQLNPAHEPYDVPRIYTPPEGGRSYLKVLGPLLDARIADHAITLSLDTRVVELLTDAQGDVTGVRAERGGDTIDFHGRKVVLACGGYVNSDAYWREFHGLPKRVYGYPHSRGDGLTAARRLGAAVAHTGHFLPTVGGTCDIDEPDRYWVHTRSSPVFRAPWEIAVNQHGRRFMAEDRKGPDRRERLLMAQPDMTFWVIYDEAIRRESPPFFLWPEEKIARAFAEHEDFQVADSLDALADRCGIDPAALRVTVDRYNSGRAVGSDEFERQYMPLPIGEAPFYAVKHYGIAVISFGGLVTDDRLVVLRDDGTPIGNLHAVGELLGAGVFGNAYLGGMMVGASLTMGRALGKDILDW